MRIDRMLSIIIILLNRNQVTARELAKEFEVSIRTIYRDIDAINLAGIPIVPQAGNRGGYSILDNYKIDHRLLSLNDLTAILSSLKGLNITLQNKDFSQTIEKIESLVPGEKQAELKDSLNKYVIDIVPWGYSEKQRQIIKVVYQAINDCQVLKFWYVNAKGEKTNRSVEPITLILKGNLWYLFAYCRLKSDFRFFRLFRMKNLEILNKHFEWKNISYLNYFNKINVQEEEINICLKFKPQAIQIVEEFYNDDQISLLDNGYLQVDVTWPESEWVYQTILSYGDLVEVLKPEKVRHKLKEKLMNMMSYYQ
ncbi:MAG: YafY family transcriptional regulator [Spirochaetes bacterium]|nr:YafY family transcriptional regulator [Spirochaetota bacterium]